MNTKAVKAMLVLTLMFAGMLLILGGSPAGAAPAATHPSPHIVEYAITVAGAQPGAIAVEAPGRIWFTMPGTDQIGLLVVGQGGNESFTYYDLDSGSDPYGIVYDGQYVWYTARGTNKLGRLDPTAAVSNAIEEYEVPTPNSGPAGLDVAPDGRIWLTEMNASQLGLFNPQNTSWVDEYLYLTRADEEAVLDKLLVANADSILFTTPEEKQLVGFTPSKVGDPIVGPFTRYTISPPDSSATYPPGDVAVNEKGHVWVSAPAADSLALRADLTQALWAFFDLPTAGANPTALAHSVEGNHSIVWFVETGAGKVGQYVKTLSGKTIGIREYGLPSANSQPADIAADTEGHVWISEPGVNKIAEWTPPYFNFVYLPLTSK